MTESPANIAAELSRWRDLLAHWRTGWGGFDENPGMDSAKTWCLRFALFTWLGGVLTLLLNSFGVTLEISHLFLLPAWVMKFVGVSSIVIGTGALIIWRKLPDASR